MDNLEFLDGSPEPNADVQPVAEPVVEQPQEPQVEPATERPRDESGRFASREQPQEQEPAPVVEKPAVPPGYVPVGVVQELRDEVRALRASQPQHQAEQPQIPDPIVDPEGYQDFQAAYARNIALNTRLDMSEEMARQTSGDQLVDQARDWALGQYQANPAFREEVLSQRNPYGYVVKTFQRQQAMDKLGSGDPSRIDAFLAWETAQKAVQQQGQQPTPETATPTRSIASAPSAGGVTHVPTGEGVAFNSMFG